MTRDREKETNGRYKRDSRPHGVRPKCIAVTQNGAECRANPVRGPSRCPMHTPEMARRISSLGGRSGHRFPKLDFGKQPETPEESYQLIGRMMKAVLEGDLDPIQANSARGMHATFLKGFEDAVIMKEMARLEAKFGLEVTGTLPEEQVSDVSDVDTKD
jgi:hypothetical protein